MSNVDTTNLTPPTPDQTQKTEPPLNNSPDARNPDGSLKAAPNAPEPKVDDKAPPKPDDKAPVAAPEKYDLKSADEKLPLDSKLVDAVTPIFKELNLSNEGAQKLVDFWNQQTTALAEAQVERFNKVTEGWAKEVVADKDLGDGKEGFNTETKTAVDAFLKSLPNEAAVRKLMDETGLGNHPDLARAFKAAGAKLKEGTPAKGSGPAATGQKSPDSNAGKTPAQRMYPDLPSAS